MRVHWAMNCRLDRLAMVLVSQIDVGIVISAISASCHEIVNIAMVTPTIVSNEVSIWLSDCCRLCWRLSMSLVTRLSRSPRGVVSRYWSGRAWSLSSTSDRSRRMVRWTTPASMRPCATARPDAAR